MKNTIIKRILAFGLYFGPLLWMLGCYSQEYIVNGNTSDLRVYQSQYVEVVARDGSQYILKAGWKSDSTGNITGEGSILRHGGEAPEHFDGMITASSVNGLTVQKIDKAKTAAALVVVGVSIYAIVEIVEFIVDVKKIGFATKNLGPKSAW